MGSDMNWKISDAIYLPRTTLYFTGDVNANSLPCFVMIDNDFQSNGTGNILENQSQRIPQDVTVPNAAPPSGRP